MNNVDLDYHAPDGRLHDALEGVSVRVDEGQFVCLLGPSGCGKTSMLNIIAGFVAPSSGEVLFGGLPVRGPGPDRGVVFQDAALFPWLTVRQNVEFGLRNAKCPQKEMSQRVEDILAAVGMTAHMRRYPHALSGGMRQRVAIARVLVLEPKTLLMDEPFNALDANTRERLQDELLRIWDSKRRTVLYVTHNVEEAAYLADRVLIMGPPPGSVRADVTLFSPRPRTRSSDALRVAMQMLRRKLNELPCCIPDPKKESV